MNKLLKTIISAASCAAVLFSLQTAGAYAADNDAQGFDGDVSNCGVYDDKGLFTEDEIAELDELVQDTASELDMYIAIYLSDTARTESSTKYFSDDAYDELFGENTDGVFYYMDLSEQYSAYDYISTSGIGNIYYGDNTDSMLDEIFDYLPASGEAIEADQIYSGIEEILTVFKEYAEDEPGFFDYYYDANDDKYTYYRDGAAVVSDGIPFSVIIQRFLFFCIIPGIIVGFLFYFITKHHYKFKKSCNPMVYVAHDETNFTAREDRFIRAYTRRTKIETSSSSGGGGSHGGGGGGSHGGGGGHR